MANGAFDVARHVKDAHREAEEKFRRDRDASKVPHTPGGSNIPDGESYDPAHTGPNKPRK